MLDYIDGIISKGYNEIEIIGHSMGAMMALQMAGKRPEIKRIIAQSGALLNTGKEIQKIRCEGCFISRYYGYDAASRVECRICNEES